MSHPCLASSRGLKIGKPRQSDQTWQTWSNLSARAGFCSNCWKNTTRKVWTYLSLQICLQPFVLFQWEIRRLGGARQRKSAVPALLLPKVHPRPFAAFWLASLQLFGMQHPGFPAPFADFAGRPAPYFGHLLCTFREVDKATLGSSLALKAPFGRHPGPPAPFANFAVRPAPCFGHLPGAFRNVFYWVQTERSSTLNVPRRPLHPFGRQHHMRLLQGFPRLSLAC